MKGYNLSVQIESINKMIEESLQETKQPESNSGVEQYDLEFEEDLVCSVSN